jgi:hypothetical protein
VPIRVLFLVQIIEELGEGFSRGSPLSLELLQKVLDLLHFMLKFHQIKVFTSRSSHFAWAFTGIKSLFQHFLILALLILDFNLFLGKFFTKPNDSLVFIFTSRRFLGSNLDAQLVNVSLKLSLLAVFRLKFFLDFSYLSIELFLFVIELINFVPKLLFIGMTDVEFVNR